MTDARETREWAAQLPEGDVVRVLLEQHARIRDLFREVAATQGDYKQQAFDELRALLAVHETAEEMVLRPVTAKTAGKSVAKARNEEERDANEALEKLETVDISAPDFSGTFAAYEKSVIAHAEKEESEEFPVILAECDEKQRASMGKRVRAAESLAPTRPNPSTVGSTGAQLTVGPFASLVDRTKDLIKGAG
jgi:hemerythrin superfamily protein